MLLDQMGIAPTKGRLGVYLTNALTGWRDPANIKINFPEMKTEFDASQKVKQKVKRKASAKSPSNMKVNAIACA